MEMIDRASIQPRSKVRVAINGVRCPHHGVLEGDYDYSERRALCGCEFSWDEPGVLIAISPDEQRDERDLF